MQSCFVVIIHLLALKPDDERSHLNLSASSHTLKIAMPRCLLASTRATLPS
jgi:hypothetical protein